MDLMDSWNKPPRKSPWDKRQPTPPNVDELLNNLQNRFRHRLPQGNAGLILIVVAATVWLATGFFIVDPQEQAVVKRFGVVDRVVGPGPHYHLPSPIENIDIEKVTEVRRLEIGFRTIDPGPPARYRQVLKESLMLTGDENIINVQFTVQYRINNLEGYLYNLTEPESTVRAASESAMREVIGDTKVMDALTVGKSLIETNTATLLQEILKGYDSGISIVNVKLQDVHPPDEVKEAFKDVVSAREDQQKMINEAEGYKNNLIPKARGEGVQVVNDAQAYAEQTVLLAQGKASRFEQIYEEYRKAKDITKARIYIETMEEVLPKVNKVIADEKLGQNFMPFLPINELRRAAGTDSGVRQSTTMR